jgi:hypothetical protein
VTNVLQRAIWDGTPKLLATWWTLGKSRRTARCHLYSHQLGWELRLEGVDDLPRTQVCRSETEVLEVQEQWRSLLETNGWNRPL